MKRILVYGDSNVWGYAKQNIRLGHRKQWTTILGKILGHDYEVINEGMPSRTAGSIDKYLPHLDGPAYFKWLLDYINPVDVMIIALGSNDLKLIYQQTADQIIDNLMWYQDFTAKIMPRAKVIFLLPANFEPGQTRFNSQARDELINRMQKLDGVHSIVLENIDLSDQVHFSKKGHRQVARVVSQSI